MLSPHDENWGRAGRDRGRVCTGGVQNILHCLIFVELDDAVQNRLQTFVIVMWRAKRRALRGSITIASPQVVRRPRFHSPLHFGCRNRAAHLQRPSAQLGENVLFFVGHPQ